MRATTLLRFGLLACVGLYVIMGDCTGAPGPAPGDERGALVYGNTTFACDLYHALKRDRPNLIFSPYSISEAFSMLYAGARGRTAQQIAQVFHFTLDPEHHHRAFSSLDRDLVSRSQAGAIPPGDHPKPQGFHLDLANALFGPQGLPFLKPFLDTLKTDYRAGFHELDFGQSEAARQTINDWVAGQTHDKIRDLLPPGTIHPQTELVLANAAYLLAAWQTAFPERHTAPGAFYVSEHETVTVPMMRQESPMGYSLVEGCEAVDLAYHGGKMSMLILLPAQGTFATFEASLTADRIASVVAVVDALRDGHVELTLPRFKALTPLSLADTLAAMGMPDAFGGQADFSGIYGGRDLRVGPVMHQAYVLVEEAGTEAAAATALGGTMGGGGNAVVTVNRPFLFLIRDRATGTVLFLGRVMNPAA